ncbi:MAG: Phosphoenolpyruvate-protein phosphotransferase of PTS system [Firmicutes bacterium]|nr:Phosphoenolpyruvate-protein phosphotransferase of PTS system [Bacillota bacterium]
MIMARSLEIPAVVGTGDASVMINTGQLIIADGIEGKVIVNPTDKEKKKYLKRKEKLMEQKREFERIKDKPAS